MNHRNAINWKYVLMPAVTVSLACLVTGANANRGRLDRQNLLEFRNKEGAVVPVRSVRNWQMRRAEILAGAQAVMGPLPGPSKRVALELRIEEEKEFGAYVRRLITYTAEPGSRVPAHVFIPKSALSGSVPRPGVLCLMGTSGYKLADAPAGPNASTNTHDGEKLAERGMVAIAPPYPLLGFGSRSGVKLEHKPDLRRLGYQSGTMKAIWDNIRALDVLESLPYVKRSGFGVIGTSLGGHNSIYTAVFDERIKVIAASCGFDSFLDYRSTHWKPGTGWSQELYMPRILDYPREEIPFDFHELIGALAPRALFVNAPVGDSNYKWQSVDRIIAAAFQVYQLYGMPEAVRVEHPDVGHSFPPEIRELAYEWIERFL
ncbi:MAG: alpha/beta hydrolase [Verrucomicrobia bacterium]|nr:alpha/beta hydrolase [Verrucomicrobiota bacterium]